MEATSSATTSLTELVAPSTSSTPPILRLRLLKKKSPKKVVWSDGTVDNEHMNKKKSKCCCIYKKPLAFGESSSEEEEECENCFGHPEKRIKTQSDPDHVHQTTHVEDDKHDSANENDGTEKYECVGGVCRARNYHGDPKSNAE